MLTICTTRHWKTRYLQ